MTHHRNTQPKSSVFFALSIGTGLLLAGCSWVPKGDPQFDLGIKDQGTASWYGEAFHGKQAADGTIYDMEGLTAAHRTFPLGSMVRVVNLVNGKYLFVRITDRGPYMNGRILDLSHRAAIHLGMERHGLSYVVAEIVGERRPDALLPSDVVDALPHARILGLSSPSGTTDPLLSPPVRLLPSDLWLQRRNWRVSAMLAADTAHTEVISLVIG